MNDLKEIGGFIVSADPYVNHDNSLSGNGTLTSPLGVVPGYNETVLYSGAYTHSTFPAITASGSIWDYEKVEITLCPASGGVRHPVTETWYTDDLALNKYVGFTACTFNGNNLNVTYPHTVFYTVSNDGKVFNPYYAGYHSQTYSGTTPGIGKQVTLAGGRFNVSGASTYELGITRIIGINRKQ